MPDPVSPPPADDRLWVRASRSAVAHAITDRLIHHVDTYTVCGRKLATGLIQAALSGRRCAQCTNLISSGGGWS